MVPIEPQTKYRVSFRCKGKHENKSVQIPEDTPASERYSEIRNVLADNRRCSLPDILIITTDPKVAQPDDESDVAKSVAKTLNRQDVGNMTKTQMQELAKKLDATLDKKATHAQMVKAICGALNLTDKVADSAVVTDAASGSDLASTRLD